MLVRASNLHVIVLSLMKFYMNMNGWIQRKLKLRYTDSLPFGEKKDESKMHF